MKRNFLQLEGELANEYFAIVSEIFENDEYATSLIELQDNLFEISIYTEHDITALLQAIAQKLKVEPIIKTEILPDIDWVQHSLNNLPPVSTDNFFIYGEHHKTLLKNNKLNIKIEANQAFGTGHHNTTLGCLTLLEKYLTANITNILDIGTGSGILSIASALFQRKHNIIPHIIASDIDSIAINIAQQNFAINNVAQYIKAIIAAGVNSTQITHHEPFDLIIANILATPLIELALDIKKLTHKDSVVILSGILKEQSIAVIKAYEEANFKLIEILQKDEWTQLVLTAA